MPNGQQSDLQLFDAPAFDRAFAEAKCDIPLFKRALATGHDHLRQNFRVGAPVTNLVRQRAWLVDRVVERGWQGHGLANSTHALVAVGGYGRGELHPGSDIDIAVLVEDGIKDDSARMLEAFIRFLFDIGLEVGHSVRTLAQCKEQAAADITIATNLMESRLLAGNRNLYEAMRNLTGPQSIWPTPVFFEAKLKEQSLRHLRYHDTAHNLEPNIKEGPGGLRDIQMIGWVAKRHFSATTLHDLVGHGFLTEEEFKALDSGQTFLWGVRFALHTLTGRREDRLLFDHQRAVAKHFGYADDESGQLGVERFMKLYYRTIMELNRLNELLLQLFREAILQSDKTVEIQYLSKRFQIRNQYIETVSDNVFRNYPFALLEIFLLLQQNPQIEGVRASTIRLIRDHRYLIDAKFRNDLKVRSLFMEIIRQPRRIGHELQRMHRYGLLEAYLPVFGAVSGLMQFDLFHVYTVDVHTLFVVQNLRRYTNPESNEAMPMCTRIMAQIPKPELLYLAGLFHDIAKGSGHDHSELGAQHATTFCTHHGLSQYDTKLVAWLVKNHLIMSMTAQRRDISDPEVINEFAQRVRDRTHLDYLYLLTVADIRGTNPTLWNSWKDALLKELYESTLRAIRRGDANPLEKDEWIAESKGEVLATLCREDLKKEAIVNFWQTLGEDYFLRHWPDEIAWHTRAIARTREDDLPLVLVRQRTRRGGSEVFIYARDEDHIFAATTSALDQLGLTIMDARIIVSPKGYTLDTYIVLEAATNETIKSDERAHEITTIVREQLFKPRSLQTTRLSRRPARQLKHFTVPTTVRFSEDTRNARTIMEVIATDRPGILSQIATAMRFCGVRLQNAKIATFGERVEDIFYLATLDNAPISDPVKIECLRRSICEALAPVQN
jgi:[protein-PII] uridylyltransferase